MSMAFFQKKTMFGGLSRVLAKFLYHLFVLSMRLIDSVCVAVTVKLNRLYGWCVRALHE